MWEGLDQNYLNCITKTLKNNKKQGNEKISVVSLPSYESRTIKLTACLLSIPYQKHLP